MYKRQVLASAGDGGSASAAPTKGSKPAAAASGTRSGTVAVRNGTGVSGLAGEAADQISVLGYTTDAGRCV